MLYADEFMLDTNSMESKCYEQSRYKLRQDLLLSALRFGNPRAKVKPKKALEEMTTFKPFNVLETGWDVWNITDYRENE